MDDWRLLLRLEPEGCFGIEMNGAVVATTTLTCYGAFAWLGMVLTHPDFRRRGFARQLIAQAVDYARLRKISTVKLDATDQGQSLYESFGFRAEQPIERWLADSVKVGGCSPPSERSFEATFSLDARACGYDRSLLVQHLLNHGRSIIGSSGYALSRPGRLRSHIGPCIAREPEEARHLIAETLRDKQAGWFWDLLPNNGEAVGLAREFGFRPDRHLTRMLLGEERRGQQDWIYAIAGFDFG